MTDLEFKEHILVLMVQIRLGGVVLWDKLKGKLTGFLDNTPVVSWNAIRGYSAWEVNIKDRFFEIEDTWSKNMNKYGELGILYWWLETVLKQLENK